MLYILMSWAFKKLCFPIALFVAIEILLTDFIYWPYIKWLYKFIYS